MKSWWMWLSWWFWREIELFALAGAAFIALLGLLLGRFCFHVVDTDKSVIVAVIIFSAVLSVESTALLIMSNSVNDKSRRARHFLGNDTTIGDHADNQREPCDDGG